MTARAICEETKEETSREDMGTQQKGLSMLTSSSLIQHYARGSMEKCGEALIYGLKKHT